MTLSEFHAGIWGWRGVKASLTVAATLSAVELDLENTDLIVVDDRDGTAPRLGAHVFVTSAGRARLGPSADHLGELAPLDYWFRALGVAASIEHVPGALVPDWIKGAPVIEITELVHRHLGYLPVAWATAAAVLDGDRSAVDFLRAYNYSTIARDHLAASEDPQALNTAATLINLGLETASHCHRTATREEIVIEESVPRKVGPQFWAFDRFWYREQRQRWHQLIDRERQGQRPFVVAGNGPSLRESLPELATESAAIRLITSNFAVLEPALEAQSHIHTVVNYMVAEQAAGLINLLPERVTVVVPFWMSYCIRPRSNVYFTETTADLRFSDDIAKEVSWVHTVSFYSMQLAAGLSTGDVALVGFDHSYDQPTDIEEGAEVVDDGPDTNHFRNDYFSGKRWQAADTDMMETVYRLAGEALDHQDRRIVNCSVQGALEQFPRASLRSFVDSTRR